MLDAAAAALAVIAVAAIALRLSLPSRETVYAAVATTLTAIPVIEAVNIYQLSHMSSIVPLPFVLLACSNGHCSLTIDLAQILLLYLAAEAVTALRQRIKPLYPRRQDNTALPR